MEAIPGLKTKKKKVLLMGKSGSGKSSMRSIVFSNYVARDTRRLGATIDVEHSHVKFLGNLTLNLWDCGGQDAFVENYLNAQRDHVFSNAGVLIYVFDIESREFDRDLITFSSCIRALSENSPTASVFCLIHKMDLVQDDLRAQIFEERLGMIKRNSEEFDIQAFATSIWDATLYKAWASIVYSLIPNLEAIEMHLQELAETVDAEEIILFERTTFLVVTNIITNRGELNPVPDRHEKLSNIIKTFKQSLAKYTGLPKSAPQYKGYHLKMANCSIIIEQLTPNTYVLLCIPPGEATFNGARVNLAIAREFFQTLDGLGGNMAVRKREVASPSEPEASNDAPNAMNSGLENSRIG